MNRNVIAQGSFIAAPDAILVKQMPENDLLGYPAQYFRKIFRLGCNVASARLYITALGVYDFCINGQEVCRDYFNPGWTDYKKRLQYQCYDISSFVRTGDNAIVATVSDGWFSGCVFNLGRHQYGTKNALLAALEITYFDGTVETIVTDESWNVWADGPIRYADFHQGEMYDFTRERGGLSLPETDCGDWCCAQIHCQSDAYHLVEQPDEPVRKMAEITPVSVTQTTDGKYIYDMGQNAVGAECVTFTGKNGEQVTLRFGEMLNQDGTLYTENLRSAAQTDIVILREGTQTFSPKFTFHGFRYIESTKKADCLSVEVLYSDCPQTGFVSTGHSMVNQLFSNQLWGQRGNFVSIPTDCPQRDERSGWTGDAQIFAKSGCYNMNAQDFYRKFMDDVMDAQRENGAVTDIAPYVLNAQGEPVIGYGNAAWADVIFVIPWTLYTMYGDVDILRRCYDSMNRHMAFLDSIATDHVSTLAFYGDWLNIDDDTDRGVLGTAYYAYDADLMSRIADVLGDTEHSAYYQEKYRSIRTAFAQNFVDADGKITGDTQCAYLLALAFNLVDDRKKTLAHLVRRIAEKDNHLATGFIGVKFLLPVLCDEGRADLAYTLLLNDTYPSWGYSIKNGATTIWERWNSYTIEGGFGDVGMNSFNHYSLGSCAEWMYEYMGGIKPLEPGFSRVSIKPYADERIGFADVTYQSAAGEIRVRWDAVSRNVQVCIPDGVSAVVETPDSTVYQDVGSGTHIFGF